MITNSDKQKLEKIILTSTGTMFRIDEELDSLNGYTPTYISTRGDYTAVYTVAKGLKVNDSTEFIPSGYNLTALIDRVNKVIITNGLIFMDIPGFNSYSLSGISKSVRVSVEKKLKYELENYVDKNKDDLIQKANKESYTFGLQLKKWETTSKKIFIYTNQIWGVWNDDVSNILTQSFYDVFNHTNSIPLPTEISFMWALQLKVNNQEMDDLVLSIYENSLGRLELCKERYYEKLSDIVIIRNSKPELETMNHISEKVRIAQDNEEKVYFKVSDDKFSRKRSLIYYKTMPVFLTDKLTNDIVIHSSRRKPFPMSFIESIYTKDNIIYEQ